MAMADKRVNNPPLRTNPAWVALEPESSLAGARAVSGDDPAGIGLGELSVAVSGDPAGVAELDGMVPGSGVSAGGGASTVDGAAPSGVSAGVLAGGAVAAGGLAGARIAAGGVAWAVAGAREISGEAEVGGGEDAGGFEGAEVGGGVEDFGAATPETGACDDDEGLAVGDGDGASEGPLLPEQRFEASKRRKAIEAKLDLPGSIFRRD